MKVLRYLLVSVLVVLPGLLLAAQEGTSGGDERVGSAAPDNAPTLSMTQDELRELVRATAENDIANDIRARNYTYIENAVEHKLGGNGEVKSAETKTYEVMQLYGEQVRRLVAKDGKPLSGKDAAKEEEKIQKLIKTRSGESEEQRRKRSEKEEKDREEERQFVREACDAYKMRVVGAENIEGRRVLVVDGDPRAGFQPKLKNAKYLPKFRVRAWIDPETKQWVRLEAEAIENISWGLFLARLNKGMHLVIEQTRVNEEVWLPRHVAVKLGGRALFKSFNMEADITYRDYRKFRADVKISGPLPADGKE